jgi:cation transport protein ChaC
LPLAPDGALWVFAYGSLIWRPGFPHESCHPARLAGFHRRFCLWSHRYRGTPERPGLVLGLDRGGTCRGVAFRVPGRDAIPVLAYLDERELPDGAEQVYHRRVLTGLVTTTGGQVRVPVVTYVANRGCRRYVPGLPDAEAAAIIAAATGQMGRNLDYLEQTVTHLAALRLPDRRLSRLLALAHGINNPPIRT